MLHDVCLKIKTHRLLANLTQQYMADELNICVRAYGKLESGETKLTVERLIEICKILNVTLKILLNSD
jgi:transcriptional regulator with XRE-family HTH domain